MQLNRPEYRDLSQDVVEEVIGRLVTDEGFRHRFVADPARALEEVVERRGGHLNPCEHRALLRIDPASAERFAAAIDPRLLKADLSRGLS